MSLLPLSIAFFLSGIAGISYELVWVRYVGRVVGGSTPAIAATVAFFLAGLALGASLFGKRFDRARRPLLAYALLEGGIGLCAALVPTALSVLERQLSATASTPLTLLACAAVLLLPTTLLGATFPAMARAIEELLGPIEGTARLYGLNTLGGVLGALLAAFLFVPILGYGTTNAVMVLFNVCAALLLLALDARSRRKVTADADARPAARVEAPAPALAYGHALAVAFASGFFAIAVEVLWTRALALSFPGTVYVFSVVLAAYLAGIAAGSLLLTAIVRRSGAAPLLPVLYLFTALGVLASAVLLPSLTELFFGLVQRGTINRWPLYIGGVGLSVLAAMLPATLAMGAALPLLIGLGSRAGRGHDAGQIYAANIVGGVAGSVATTFALMPWLGLSRALGLAAVGYLFLATTLLRLTALRPGVRRGLAFGALALALGTLGGAYPEATPAEAPRPGRRLLYHRDAPSGTIAIHEEQQGGHRVRSLEINNFYGLNQTLPSTVAMQYRLGHIPLLLHPNPRAALLLGFATGSTLAAMAEHPLERLDCVELHPELLRLASSFSRANQRVFADPRVRLFAADGRRFVLVSRQRYDVIVSDLFLPRNPGVGSLYSVEHFRAARRRLRPGGLFALWLPLWQLSSWEAGVIVHTFLEVFPDAVAQLGNPSPGRPALGLMGPGPRPALRAALPALLAARLDRSMQRAFGPAAQTPREEQLLLLSSDALRRWANDKPLNTLDHPVIEFSAPRTLLAEQLARRQGGLATTNLRLLRRLAAAP